MLTLKDLTMEDISSSSSFGYNEKTYSVKDAISKYGKRKPTTVSISKLIHNTRENMWFYPQGDMPTVLDVVGHCERIINAELKYPLLVSIEDYIVLDGMHRLCKYMLNNKGKEILVEIILLTEEEIAEIKEIR